MENDNQNTANEIMDKKFLEKVKRQFDRLTEVEKEKLRVSISWFFLNDSIKRKIIGNIQKKLRFYDLISVIFSLLSIFTEFLASYYYLDVQLERHDNLVSVKVGYHKKKRIEIIRAITSLFTIILIILIIIHYHTEKMLKIFRQNLDITTSLYETGQLPYFFLEIIIILIHTPPFLNGITVSLTTFDSNKAYDIDIILFINVIVLVRIYITLKYYFRYSKWGDERTNRICKESNVSHGFIFILKAELAEHPYFHLLILLICVIGIFGFSLRNCEMPFIQDIESEKVMDWRNLWNCVWCVITTIMTIGYGDFVPKTLIGRILTIICLILGTISFGILLVFQISNLKMSQQELQAYKEIKKSLIKKKLKKKALELIICFYRLNRICEFNQLAKSTGIDAFDHEHILERKKNEIQSGISQIYIEKKEFSNLRKFYIKIEEEETMSQYFNNILQKVNDKMSYVSYLSKVESNKLVIRIKYSLYFQNLILYYSEILKKMNQSLTDSLKKHERSHKVSFNI
jgi:hypothetical protein